MAHGAAGWNKEEPRPAWVKIGLKNKGTVWGNLRVKNQELESKNRTKGMIRQDSERRLRKAIKQKAESVETP